MKDNYIEPTRDALKSIEFNYFFFLGITICIYKVMKYN